MIDYIEIVHHPDVHPAYVKSARLLDRSQGMEITTGMYYAETDYVTAHLKGEIK